jgi:hypothetical protein
MNITNADKLYGVTEGVYYGQFDRTGELNDRIGSRHFPDAHLQPNINFRPVPTKYARFPIIDRKTPSSIPVNRYLDHDVEFNFNPGNSRAPAHGYMNNVDKEMLLRNQFFALQRGGNKGVYIPSSTSDLYNSTMHAAKGQYENTGGTHLLLFSRPDLNGPLHPNVANNSIGKYRFFNHTRTQLRGEDKQ